MLWMRFVRAIHFAHKRIDFVARFRTSCCAEPEPHVPDP
jgi:hypothetical protein